nr:MAG TPA: hypothetical protein [Caudoviricetes sp.]
MDVFLIVLILLIVALGTFVHIQQMKWNTSKIEESDILESNKYQFYTKQGPIILNADVIGLRNGVQSIKFVKYDFDMYFDKKMTKLYEKGEELPMNFQLYTNITSLPTTITFRVKINGEWY